MSEQEAAATEQSLRTHELWVSPCCISKMPASSRTLFALAVLVAAPSAFAWPIKTFDYSDDGALCDTTKEQYIQVEAYDYHQYPKITMTWSQLTGPCGVPVAKPASWTEVYDVALGDLGPNNQGRVQLNIFVCAPFGEYELTLDVQSYTDTNSGLAQRTSWELENGEDEYHIWDTVNTNLKDVEAYAPTVPGVYTWPLPGAEGYYSKLLSGPLPPLQCTDYAPAGTKYEGCYADSSRSRVLKAKSTSLPVQGEDGMTNQRCSDFCTGYDYFGTEFGFECHCGSKANFNAATPSDQCGMTYESYCFGNAYETCGGRGSISIYSRTAGGPTPTPPPPAPHAAPPVIPGTYTKLGCYVDSEMSRLMTTDEFKNEAVMSAEICFSLCNDGVNTHFGTQYANECFCGKDVTLTKHGAKVLNTECNIVCQGATDGEKCGGRNRITAYEIGGVSPTPISPTPISPPTVTTFEYEGCYVDARSARIMPEQYVETAMSAQLCFDICNDGINTHFGTQFAKECFCGESPNLTKNGAKVANNQCSSTCLGSTDGEKCGGRDRLSAYRMGGGGGGGGGGAEEYKGCFADLDSSRALPDNGKYSEPGMMTTEVCLAYCKSNGYMYAGTQYYHECWCSNSSDYDKNGNAANCNTPCDGSASQMCGGRNAVSVYEV